MGDSVDDQINKYEALGCHERVSQTLRSVANNQTIAIPDLEFLFERLFQKVDKNKDAITRRGSKMSKQASLPQTVDRLTFNATNESNINQGKLLIRSLSRTFDSFGQEKKSSNLALSYVSPLLLESKPEQEMMVIIGEVSFSRVLISDPRFKFVPQHEVEIRTLSARLGRGLGRRSLFPGWAFCNHALHPVYPVFCAFLRRLQLKSDNCKSSGFKV